MTIRASAVSRPLLGLLAALAVVGTVQMWLPPTSADQVPVSRGQSAPPGALVLFDGTDTSQWRSLDGGPARWPIADDALEVCSGCGDVRTAQAFGDFRLHLEFWLPVTPDDAAEQDRGNSGIYLQQRYELQVLDSFGRALSGRDDAAAIYGFKDADTNAARPAESWQTYDVTFRAARWSDGTRVENARLSLAWNDVLVHADVELPSPTPGGDAESPDPGPILLQDHGHRVRYRNIWIEPSDSATEENRTSEGNRGTVP